MTAKFIFEANIAHYEGLISKEKRPSKRVRIKKLLAEEGSQACGVHREPSATEEGSVRPPQWAASFFSRMSPSGPSRHLPCLHKSGYRNKADMAEIYEY